MNAHVVILAAGRGSRLGSLGDDTPKWLLRVGSRTLAERHLDGLRRVAPAVSSVSVVTGHAADAISSVLPEGVTALPNPDYEVCNNWWSVLLALRQLPDDGPVVFINADLMIEPAEIGAFLRAAVFGAASGLLAVDFEQPVTEESMKVSFRADGALRHIGKAGIDGAAGEYVGMLMARDSTLRAFRGALEAFVGRPEHRNEWYEAAIGRAAAAGAEWRAWSVSTGLWVEIDDERDLCAAEELAAS